MSQEIAKYLKCLNQKIEYIPAVGGAIEELKDPDREEREDFETGTVENFVENPEPNSFYHSTPLICRTDDHVFQFFVDGSEKAYFVETGIERGRSFPVEIAQIGAVVIQRSDDGNLKIFKHDSKNLFLVPKGSGGLSDTAWKELNQIDVLGWELVNYGTKELHKRRVDKRDTARGKVVYIMHQLEVDIIKETNTMRNENCWLILDGNIRFSVGETVGFVKEPYVIGVAKMFKKDPVFKTGVGKEKKDITTVLAGLPVEHRTSVFPAPGGNVAFWYVRIREQRHMDYPLMGVVKIEIPLNQFKDGLVPADLANRLSGALVAERSPSIYGLDNRWHCSIYPIYMAEQVIKNSFASRDVVFQQIRSATWKTR
jgi:hypothetical protein